MATNGADTKVSTPRDLSDIDMSDSSDAEVDGGGGDTPTNEEPKEIEWLATSRAKRSTAGNRMKAMLANEEPAAEDSDLELLFAEDEDDAGFTDDEKEDASDVQMDSSSEDEDQENAGDEDEGEKELERENREKRKRKAQAAIPAKFRKKVRIEQPATAADPASPSSTAVTVTPRPPRPKKKSERTSWLPSAADLPTRASERSTTRISKQQLHQKMVSDEIRRKKQLERMEKKAKLLEASKKPPMTQEERLAEAAIVEKRNSKSLNRWEEAEKQREEERLKKIAALNNRKLDGPVVTFWSGIQELSEAQSNHVGNLVSMEVKAPRKKRQPAAAILAAKEAGNGEPATPATPATPVEKPDGKVDEKPAEAVPEVKMENADTPTLSAPPAPAPAQTQQVSPVVVPQEDSASATVPTAAATPAPVPAPAPIPAPVPVAAPIPAPAPVAAPALPAPPSSSTPPATVLASMAPPPIPPPPADTRLPSTSGILAAPILAPPVGITPPMLGAPVSMLGLAAPNGPNGKSNVLALPNTTHTPSPLSLPPSAPAAPVPATAKPQPPPITTNIGPAASLLSPSPKTIVPPPPLPSATPVTPATPNTPFKPTQGKASATPKNKPPDTPAEPPSAAVPTSAMDPPREGKVTRSCIILQNFDEAAIKDKQVQTQILFGRKMNRLAKPSQPPLCVITNYPAKYRDPKTGLPYYNSYAYREIQRVHRGDYKWSSLLGAYVGRGDYTARGVPDRFKDAYKGLPVEKRPEPRLVPIEGADELKVEEKDGSEKIPVEEATEPEEEGKEKQAEAPAPVTAPAPVSVPASTPLPTCTPILTPTPTTAAPDTAKV